MDFGTLPKYIFSSLTVSSRAFRLLFFFGLLKILLPATPALAECKIALVNPTGATGGEVNVMSTNGRLARSFPTEGNPVGAAASNTPDSTIYFAEQQPNRISRMKSDGSDYTVVLELAQPPTALVLTDESIYWAEEVSQTPFTYRIMAANRSDMTQVEIFEDLGKVPGMDADPAGRLYWVTESVRRNENEFTSAEVLTSTLSGDDVQRILNLNEASESEGYMDGASLPTDITIDPIREQLYISDQISPITLSPNIIWRAGISGDEIEVFKGIPACILPRSSNGCQLTSSSVAYSSTYDSVFVTATPGDVNRVYQIHAESRELRIAAYFKGHDLTLLGLNEGLCLYSNSLTGGSFSELNVWRPTSGTWFVRRYDSSSFVQQWGLPGDVPISANFNADVLNDMAVWRPSEANWYLCDWNGTGICSSSEIVQWGLPGDIPIAADFDGDSLSEIAVWRPSEGRWYVRLGQFRQWGLPGDLPLTADFNGDGKADFVVFRPSTATWYILYSSFNGDIPDESVTLTRQWGLPGDHPFTGDYDNDGRPDLVVWRPSTGTWFICPSQAEYNCETHGIAAQFGLPMDLPIDRNIDFDIAKDLVVWRASTGTWFYQYAPGFSSDVPIVADSFGAESDIPIGYSVLTLARELGIL